MNSDTTFLVALITSLTITITFVIIYSSLGSGSKNLIDPFEEDGD